MFNNMTHILLDAARMNEYMSTAQELNKQYDSLYRGGVEESLSEVAPYIFIFPKNSEFSNWYINSGWGDSWGILLKSSLSLPELHKHFRKFLMVQTEDGDELYFRFYDPRVLRIFLPTCNAQQLTQFFGPVQYFFVEQDTDTGLQFWLENGNLRQQLINVKDYQQNNIVSPIESTGEDLPSNNEHKNKPPGWKLFD